MKTIEDSTIADLVVIRRKRKANDIVADSTGSGHRIVEDESRAKATPEPRPALNRSHAVVMNDDRVSHDQQPESEPSNDTSHHHHHHHHHHHQECEASHNSCGADNDGCPQNDVIVRVTPPEFWTDAQPRYPLVNRLEDVKSHSPVPHCGSHHVPSYDDDCGDTIVLED